MRAVREYAMVIALVATALVYQAHADICPAVVTDATGNALSSSLTIGGNDAQAIQHEPCRTEDCDCEDNIVFDIDNVYEDWERDLGDSTDVRIKITKLRRARGNLTIRGGVFNHTTGGGIVPDHVRILQIFFENLQLIDGDLIIENTAGALGYSLAVTLPVLSVIRGNVIIRTSGTGDPLECSVRARFGQDLTNMNNYPPWFNVIGSADPHVDNARRLRTIYIGGDLDIDIGCGASEKILFRAVNVSGNVRAKVSNSGGIRDLILGHSFVETGAGSTTADSFVGGNISIAAESEGAFVFPVQLLSNADFFVQGSVDIINTAGWMAGLTSSPGLRMGSGSSGVKIEESDVPDRISNPGQFVAPLFTGSGSQVSLQALDFQFGSLSIDSLDSSSALVTVRVDRRSNSIGGTFDDMNISYGSSFVASIARARLVQCVGYAKMNIAGTSPESDNCLPTRPPTIAPSTDPTSAPTRAPITTAPTPRPTTSIPSKAPSTPVPTALTSPNAAPAEDDSGGSTVIIIVVIVLVLALAIGGFLAYTYWKKSKTSDKDDELVGDNFMVNPAYKSMSVKGTTPSTSRMSASLASASPAKSTSADLPQEDYLIPAKQKKKKTKGKTTVESNAQPSYEIASNTTVEAPQPGEYLETQPNYDLASTPSKPKKKKKKKASTEGSTQPNYDLASAPGNKKKKARVVEQNDASNPSFDSNAVASNADTAANDGGYLLVTDEVDHDLQQGVYDNDPFGEEEEQFGF